MKCTKSVVVFVVDHDMITREISEKIQKLLFYFWEVNCQSSQTSKVQEYTFNWPERSLTTVEDKPLKLFCKTSLNGRE